MSQILIRFHHPGGLGRMNFDLSNTFGNLYEELGKRCSISPENVLISLDNKKYIKFNN